MGGLTVSVTAVPFKVGISTSSIHSCEVSADPLNSISLGANGLNIRPQICIKRKGGARLTAGLVYKSSLGGYELLYVTDGVLMVIDGYLKVIKDGREKLQA